MNACIDFIVEGVYQMPLRSATALEVCFAAPLGSGTEGPTGKVSHSEGQRSRDLRKTAGISQG